MSKNKARKVNKNSKESRFISNKDIKKNPNVTYKQTVDQSEKKSKPKK